MKRDALLLLLEIDRKRQARTGKATTQWIAPLVTAIAGLLGAGFADGEIRMAGSRRALSLFLLAFDIVLLVLLSARVQNGLSDILRRTRLTPVADGLQGAFVCTAILRTPTILVLMGTGIAFAWTVAGPSPGRSALAAFVMGAHCALIVLLVTVACTLLLRSGRTPAFFVAVVSLAVLVCAGAGLLAGLPDPLTLVYPVSVTAQGILDAGSGEGSSALLNAAALCIPLLFLGRAAFRRSGYA